MPRVHVVVDVRSRLPKLGPEAKAKAAKAVAKAALDMEVGAKVRAPVDTGLLRNAIYAVPDTPLEWRVVSPVRYSVFQEYGTRRHPAHPYMTPAVEAVLPQLRTALRKLV